MSGGRAPAHESRPAAKAPERPRAAPKAPARQNGTETASFALFTRPPTPSAGPPEDPLAERGRLGPGSPLEPRIRTPMERGFRDSLGGVRVHTDGAAAALARDHRARAVTIGGDIAFAAGEYRPETLPGRALIAHELAHTLQQRGGPPRAQTASGETGELERDADRGALAAALAPGAWRPLRAGLRLQRCNGGSTQTVTVAPQPTRPPEQAPRTTLAPSYQGIRGAADFPHPSFFDRTMLVDGDGDQAPELRMRVRVVSWNDLREATRFRIEMEQVSRPGVVLPAEFDVPQHAHVSAQPMNVRVTDGWSPTIVDMQDYTYGTRNEFLLFPPWSTGKATSYRSVFRFQSGFGAQQWVEKEHVFDFPPETAPGHTVFQAGSPVESAPGLWRLDMKVGAYADPFRLTVLKPVEGKHDVVLSLSTVVLGKAEETALLKTWEPGNLMLSVVRSWDAGLALDLNGDGSADVTLYDQLTAVRDPVLVAGPTDPSRNRDHRITARGTVGNELGSLRVEVREGLYRMQSLGYMQDVAAIFQAQAETALAQQVESGTFLQQISALAQARSNMRHRARERHLISQALFDSWNALSQDVLFQLTGGAGEEPARTPQQRQLAAAQHAQATLQALQAEPGLIWANELEAGVPVEAAQIINPYTGARWSRGVIPEFNVQTDPAHLTAMAAAVILGRWNQAIRYYDLAEDGLDRWIARRLREGGFAEEAQQLEGAVKMAPRLRELSPKNPEVAHAMFYPHDPKDPVGRSALGYPVPLYYWREDREWHLRCYINPDDPFTKRVADNGEALPPHTLFEALDEGGYFPEGYLFYSLLPPAQKPSGSPVLSQPGPRGRTGRVVMEAPMTTSQKIAWAATAVAAVGFIALTAGAGSVVVTAIFAIAGGLGAVSAGVHIAEQVRDESLTPGELVVDVIQIVGSLAGAGAAISLEVQGAKAAVAAGTASKTAQVLAGWEGVGRMLVPLAATAATADVIQFAVFTENVVKGLRAIDASTTMNEGEKSRARALLLAQFAGLGALTILAVKGSVRPNIVAGERMILEVVDGAPVLRLSAGAVNPTEYRTALSDVLSPQARKAFGDVEVTTVSAQRFRELTDDVTGSATVLVEKGKPRVYVVEGAPPRVVAEEAAHLEQLLDPRLARQIGLLDEAWQRQWKTLTSKQRAVRWEAKLELEIDAQQRVINGIDGRIRAGVAPEQADDLFRQLDDAWQNLENLRTRFADLVGYEQQLARRAASAEPEFLSQPPRLLNKPTTAETPLDDTWRNLKPKEFVKAYKDRYPNSTLDEAELLKRYDMNLRLNPTTWRLRGPAAEGRVEPDISARYKQKEWEKLSTADVTPPLAERLGLDPKQKMRRDQLLKERDAARADRDKLAARTPPDEKALAGAHYRVQEASRQLGEMHAEAFVQQRYPGSKRIYPPGEGSRSGDFDQVWEQRIPGKTEGEWIFVYIVVEAKGGSSALGTRRVAGGLRAQQGTREYYNKIVELMAGSGGAGADAATRLAAARAENIHYVHVKVPIESGATSAATTVQVREFDLGP